MFSNWLLNSLLPRRRLGGFQPQKNIYKIIYKKKIGKEKTDNKQVEIKCVPRDERVPKT